MLLNRDDLLVIDDLGLCTIKCLQEHNCNGRVIMPLFKRTSIKTATEYDLVLCWQVSASKQLLVMRQFCNIILNGQDIYQPIHTVYYLV